RRRVAEDLLSWLDLSVIAQELEGGRSRDPDGGSLLEREIGWLVDQLILGCRRVLREGAIAPSEHLITYSKALHDSANRLDSPGDISSRNAVLWLAQPGREAHDVRHACHQDPVADMDGCGVHTHQHFAVADLRPLDVLRLQDLD